MDGVGIEFIRELAIQAAIDIVLLTALMSIIGMLVVKYLVREISLMRVWWICFRALCGIFLILTALLIFAAWSGLNISAATDGALFFVAFCGAVWVIRNDLQGRKKI
jgi:hypothetical protein